MGQEDAFGEYLGKNVGYFWQYRTPTPPILLIIVCHSAMNISQKRLSLGIMEHTEYTYFQSTVLSKHL